MMDEHDQSLNTRDRDAVGGGHYGPGPDTPAGRRRSRERPPSSGRHRARIAALSVLIGFVVATAVVLIDGRRTFDPGAGPLPSQAPPAAAGAGDGATRRPVPARPVDAATLAALPKADTFTTVTAAPADAAAATTPSGRVLHPSTTVPVYAAPGGAPIAALPTTQLGSDTWVPVVGEQPGWAQVLLPVRPNGSTGWIADDDAIVEAHTAYRLILDRAGFTLRLLKDGTETGRWTVGVGKPDAVTPAGRTFLLASIQDTKPTFSPIVLPLGSHSDTHQTYGGGPGTVGIHGWPSANVFGKASSDGCVRVPADALRLISSEVPLGTPVLVS